MSRHPGGQVPGNRRFRLPRTAALAVLAALALLLAACSSGGSSSSSTGGTGASSSSSSSASSSNVGNGRSVTLGTKDFTEEFIVGALYQQALQAKGYKVVYKPNIGATEVVDKALTSGQIDAYPEYTGESTVTVGGINTTVTSAQQEYDLAKAFYAKRGQSMSDMTPFFDTDAIGVTKAFADKYGLKTTADLKKVPHFTLGARPEFQGREQGAVGIQKDYGVKNFTFKSLALGIQYQALDSGAVDAADVFTTDPQLASGKYVVLSDPKHIFGFQNIALIINTKKLNELGGQQFMNIINQVNALLTTPAIIAMNKAVAIDKQQPGDVAKSFLSANHITS
jgi:osmoprotectant transport system substrate-binding protein